MADREPQIMASSHVGISASFATLGSLGLTPLPHSLYHLTETPGRHLFSCSHAHAFGWATTPARDAGGLHDQKYELACEVCGDGRSGGAIRGGPPTDQSEWHTHHGTLPIPE